MSYFIRGMGSFGDFQPELCDPTDVACVQRNVAASVAYQQQQGEVHAQSNYDQCIANGTDAGTCAARWPSGYSGEIPFTNLTPQQQAGEMQTPVQAEVSYLQVPNVAQELKDYNVNPAGLITAVGPVTWNTPVATPSGGGSSGGGGGTGSPGTTYLPAAAGGTAAVTTPPFAPVAQTGQMRAPVQPQGAPALTSTLSLPDFTQGFSFSSIPLWGWAAIAIGGFMLLGGKR